MAEEFFGVSFDGVSVLTGPGTGRGVSGSCLDADRIWLRADLPEGQDILLHELCHIAQRRAGVRADRAAPTALLEAQAHWAPFLFQRGEAMPPLPARDPRPLHWGPAGHYYTVYVVALAAGCTPHQAFRYAFFAQIADLIDELDATARGISLVFNPFESGTAIHNDIWVQEGLHTLTGRPSAKETLVRRNILKNTMADEFRCGLAAHAYGDSYAHRMLENEAMMYKPVAGHAIEWLNGQDPHCPDFLNQRPSLYESYVSTLYSVFSLAPGARPRMPLPDLLRACLRAANVSGEEKQISRLRDCASHSCGTLMLPFAPEEQTSLESWGKFMDRWPLIMGKYRLVDALTLARQWASASV